MMKKKGTVIGLLVFFLGFILTAFAPILVSAAQTTTIHIHKINVDLSVFYSSIPSDGRYKPEQDNAGIKDAHFKVYNVSNVFSLIAEDDIEMKKTRNH